MRTNYYVTINLPSDGEGLHIGQHSSGWEFLFRAHRDLGLVSAEAWHQYLATPGAVIRDERTEVVSLPNFWPVATHIGRTRFTRNLYGLSNKRWHDDRGYAFADYEFC